jgi:addiction module RelE/StbE family toxin
MWKVVISKAAVKELESAPAEIKRKYTVWLGVIKISGVPGVVAVKGFRDHALAGQWQGYRSSSLNYSWRVIYQVEQETVTISIKRVSNHDYR